MDAVKRVLDARSMSVEHRKMLVRDRVEWRSVLDA